MRGLGWQEQGEVFRERFHSDDRHSAARLERRRDATNEPESEEEAERNSEISMSEDTLPA
jgi:hypothetical protein